MESNILKTIGNTPLVQLNNMNPRPEVVLALKLEGTNPGGSIKDRIALFMIEAAEKSGELKKGKIILEPTSGNTGIGLAMVASFKGYRLMVTMPENMSIERRRILEAFGAEVILTPAALSTDGAIERAYEIVSQDPELYFMPNQFNNENNMMAHYHTTAPEIWNQTGGLVTHVIAGIGTTGTLMGISKKLKEMDPRIRIIGVEPYPNHSIQGLKNLQEAIVPGIYNPKMLDEIIKVPDREAFVMTNELVRKEGIFSGISTGAALYGAMEILKKIDHGVVVAISPDRGDKYVSTTNLYCMENCENRSENCRFPG